MTETTRADGRNPTQLRPIQIITPCNPYAEGSAQISFGNTTVIVTATIEQETPKWMADGSSGWITAEYGMLPRATHTRNKREAAGGKQGGRTLEIQRLVGRALRAAVPLEQIPGLTIRVDCDVVCADGGTRCASICGGWVALVQALRWAAEQNLIERMPDVTPVCAVSVGKLGGQVLVDLAYTEDSQADFDLNFVFLKGKQLVEFQGTGERAPISPQDIPHLIDLGYAAAEEIFAKLGA